MNCGHPSMALLAAGGGDTVKLFDTSIKPPGDTCPLSYTPSPGCQVNSVKWNHTNLVVASAGDDKKISLWRKNGHNMGTIPVAGTDSGDNIEESILALSFSNKASRYLCSGGSGQVVRIWDLSKKRCIKWLRGHTDTVAGIMYNCKDEHLASISLSGDLILHNLASGAKAVELKDPNEQVLRVLDYSRISRHLLATAGDDGTVHLWDTTGHSPKVSWLKQHSAPTSGIGFSPANDKIIASVGLDKKLYTYDSGSRRPSSCISYEAPFCSLAFRDDGWMLAAGTSNGRVAFYDVRGKPQPFVVLQAYGSSEAVTSLCWQRSKPVIVNESNCTAETALVGDATEGSVLMPDPLPSSTSLSVSLSTAVSGSRYPSRLGTSLEASSLTTSRSEFSSSKSTAEETPQKSHLWPIGTLSRLNAPHSSYKDDMDVFSPLVDVQPITPSLWEENGAKKDIFFADRKLSSLLFRAASKRFTNTDDRKSDPPIFDWKSGSTSKQDESQSSLPLVGSTPPPTSKNEDSSITPSEAWGGERLSDKCTYLRQPVNAPSRLGMLSSSGQTAGSMFSEPQDPSSSASISSLTNSSLNYCDLRMKDVSTKNEDSFITPSEGWGGERLSDKYTYLCQPVNAPSRLGMLSSGGQTAGSMFSGLQNPSSSASISSLTNSSFNYSDLRMKDFSTSQETSLQLPDHLFSRSLSLTSINTRTSLGQGSLDSPRMSPLTLPRRFSTYAERISSTSTFSDGVSLSVSSPKVKKSGAETREELLNSLLVKSDTTVPAESGSLPLTNGVRSHQKASQSDAQGSSFTLQLFQRTLEETLDSFQKSIHEDMRNLHIEILRQFHLQEIEMSNVMNSILENQAELMKEVKSLRKENQQLRQML